MNVKQLKELLEFLPEDFEVFSSVDSEGNGFNTVNEATLSYIDSDGDINPYDENGEELPNEDMNCVILWN